MSLLPQTLNGISAIGVRVIIPWRGAWVADVELDAELVALAPTSGPAVLTVGNVPMVGTVDPRGSGSFNDKAYARVVGGRGGWDKTVKAQHFANPAGVLLSTQVYATTGLEVGEIVADPIPQVFGKDFARTSGPASRVFGDADWFVEPVSGTTIVSAWPTLPYVDEILDWDASSLRGILSADALVTPGTLLVDPRFNGKTFTVRDVEQTFDRNGSIAEVWCSENGGSRLATAFTNAVREAAQTQYLKTYLYRFVLAVGGKLALQAATAGAPDLNPIDQWTGLSGASCKLLPGTEIVVGFMGGDPRYPYTLSFSPLGTPLETDIAGGAFPLVVAPWAVGAAAAVAAFAAAVTATGALPMASFPNVAAGFAALATAATTLSNALTALPPPATILTKAT